MSGHSSVLETGFLGDLPPLSAEVMRMPDRHQVSLRWLSGTVLVGVTSAFLMGGALMQRSRVASSLPFPRRPMSALPANSGPATRSPRVTGRASVSIWRLPIPRS